MVYASQVGRENTSGVFAFENDGGGQGKMKKKKQTWGNWVMGQGVVYNRGSDKKIPMRIMIQVPYDWHLTHNGEHTRKYWAKRRKEKGK